MNPTRARRPRCHFLIAGLALLALGACHSTKRKACCGADTDCCQPALAHGQHGWRDEDRREQGERREQQGQERQQRGDHRGQNRGNQQPEGHRGDRGEKQRTMRQHEQEDRVHLEIHERLDRLTERVAELSRRLDQLTGERKTAPRSIR